MLKRSPYVSIPSVLHLNYTIKFKTLKQNCSSCWHVTVKNAEQWNEMKTKAR